MSNNPYYEQPHDIARTYEDSTLGVTGESLSEECIIYVAF